MPKITSKSFRNLIASKLTVSSKGNTTQGTSITTTVTCDASAGYITTVSSTLAANTSTAFKVNNSHVDADSCIVANISNYAGSTGVPFITIDAVATGEFYVSIRNVSDSAALNGTMTISFIVV